MDLFIKKAYKCRDGRWRAYCVDENGKPHVISYPRILMAKKLGRPLKPEEDVHHKDENPDNNDLSNLEILVHGEHQKQHSRKYKDTIETCIICGAKFVMKSDKWTRFYVDINRGRTRYLTCSKSCSGKVGSHSYKLLYRMENRLKEVELLW